MKISRDAVTHVQINIIDIDTKSIARFALHPFKPMQTMCAIFSVKAFAGYMLLIYSGPIRQSIRLLFKIYLENHLARMIQNIQGTKTGQMARLI